jgi:hypothetical protein
VGRDFLTLNMDCGKKLSEPARKMPVSNARVSPLLI